MRKCQACDTKVEEEQLYYCNPCLKDTVPDTEKDEDEYLYED